MDLTTHSDQMYQTLRVTSAQAQLEWPRMNTGKGILYSIFFFFMTPLLPIGGASPSERLSIRTSVRLAYFQQGAAPSGWDLCQGALWGEESHKRHHRFIRHIDNENTPVFSRWTWCLSPSSSCTTSSREWWDSSSLGGTSRKRRWPTKRTSSDWSPQVCFLRLCLVCFVFSYQQEGGF